MGAEDSHEEERKQDPVEQVPEPEMELVPEPDEEESGKVPVCVFDVHSCANEMHMACLRLRFPVIVYSYSALIRRLPLPPLM